jgi:hypothetical protein
MESNRRCSLADLDTPAAGRKLRTKLRFLKTRSLTRKGDELPTREICKQLIRKKQNTEDDVNPEEEEQENY